MPYFETAGRRLYYETHGEGFPVLAFAPGGMRSAIDRWQLSKIKAVDVLASRFHVIVLDQRNAGRSKAPVTADDGWGDYTADHLALLDHLEVERCHLLGVCIGGSFGLSLIRAAPERVSRAVLIQPIGNSGHNRREFYALFDGWASDLPQAARPDDAALASFRSRLYDGDFVYSVTRDFVKQCPTPLLVLMGDDVYHPASISREVVELAPHARLIEDWKEGEARTAAEQAIVRFLTEEGSEALQ